MKPVILFAIIAITLGVLVIAQDPKKAPEVVPDCQYTIDSLQDELFIQKSYVGRYELTLEHLKQVDPKAAEEFNQYLEHETE